LNLNALSLSRVISRFECTRKETRRCRKSNLNAKKKFTFITVAFPPERNRKCMHSQIKIQYHGDFSTPLYLSRTLKRHLRFLASVNSFHQFKHYFKDYVYTHRFTYMHSPSFVFRPPFLESQPWVNARRKATEKVLVMIKCNDTSVDVRTQLAPSSSHPLLFDHAQ
jgi:hypothetical protein